MKAWPVARTLEAFARDHVLWVEIFVVFNLAFLVLDIYIAHSVNVFRHWAEYIPLYFSVVAPFLLAAALLARTRGLLRIWISLGHLVGWTSLAIGLGGVLFHLQSAFFLERTLKSLTYAAPFVAPLSYAGLGLLLIMNRMVAAASKEWAQWVLLLALGGFAGNFILSLTDHAINGFYYSAEWIPVASSAFAVGFLAACFLEPLQRCYRTICIGVMGAQALVGMLGFGFHVAANWNGPSADMVQNFIHGAPAFAPLLFPNLMVLALIGLFGVPLRASEKESTHPSPLLV